MAEEGLLKDPDCKTLIKHCIRTATETSGYHFTAHYRTKEVEDLTRNITNKSQYHKFCSQNFRHEHIVPCQVIYEMLLGLTSPNHENIEHLLTKFCIRATITIEDDKQLIAHKLNSKMPNEFYTKSAGAEELFQNPFARYLVAGIYDKLVKTTNV